MKQPMHNRILSFLLAFLLFLSNVPFSVLSIGSSGDSAQSGSTAAPQLQYDYNTMYIARDGKQIQSLPLLSHEKIELSADGIAENAKYQWQVEHPEKDGVWVNIYDGTEKTISVTLALVENVLRENGTAKLRCRAYTDTYAYLSNTVTVVMAQEQTVSSKLAMAPGGAVTLADDEPVTPEFVTVTVRYHQTNYTGNDLAVSIEDVFVAYVATMAYGENGAQIQEPIECPLLVGYTPKIYSVTVGQVETADVVHLNGNQITFLDADYLIQGNIEIVVHYEPVKVNYRVRYFFQNIYDDLYSENVQDYPSVTSEGYTGTTPDLKQKTVDGFTCLYYQPDTIAADGSTVFHVYYERNYYLMEFDCNGGYGTDTLYVRYGTYISVPAPVKPGWSFGNWDLIATDDPNNSEELGPDADNDSRHDGDGLENALPDTMPCFNSAYKALWNSADTTFTVVYWLENADDSEYSYFSSVQVKAQTGTVLNLQTIQEYSYCTNPQTNEYKKVTLNLTDLKSIDIARHATLDVEKTEDGYDQDKDGEQINYGTATDPLFGIALQGDGSTTFNIFYSRETYTLKFYYAMEGQKDTDDALDYSVIGGSSHYFGSLGSSNASEVELYRQYATGSSKELAGEVKKLPELNSPSLYEEGVDNDSNNGFKYYYFFFSAKYGEDISDRWPRNAFEPVEVSFERDDWKGGYAVFSAWNGEKKVKYCSYGNQTVKGNYMQLTEEILWDPIYNSGYADSSQKDVNNDGKIDNTSGTVAFVAFWENGDNTGWSIPELYVYRIWIRCPDPEVYKNLGYQIKQRENSDEYYYLFDSYFTCDNSSISEQTVPAIVGYDVLDPKPNDGKVPAVVTDTIVNWTPIFVTNTNKSSDNYFYTSEISYNGSTFTDGKRWEAQTILSTKPLGDSKYLLYNPVFYNPDAEKPIAGAPGDTFDHEHYSQGYYLDFFYSSTEHKLKYYNYDNYLNYYLHEAGYPAGDGSTIAYGTKLTIYGPEGSMVTDDRMQNLCYPNTLEPGAYRFAGWYTSPTFKPGTEMNWDATMPDSDFTVYAKWEPVRHEVKFFVTFDDMEDYLDATEDTRDQYLWNLEDPLKNPTTIPHGETLGTAYGSLHPTRTGYIDENHNGVQDPEEPTIEYDFVGWFYIDENGKKRFAPDTMPVKKGLNLFAEWRTQIDTNYQIEYRLENTNEVIADPTVGYISAGFTKTFQAKAGSQLYVTGKNLFPKISSHSLLMDPDPSKNVFTFEYVEDTSVSYQVQYLDKVTGLPVHDPKDVENVQDAIVTEKFEPVTGYVPESYYITKVLESDDGYDGLNPHNIIIFYYIPTERQALYTVQFYQEKVESTDPDDPANYELVDTSVLSGIIDAEMTYTIVDDKYVGFDFQFADVVSYKVSDDKLNKVGPVLSGTLTEKGLEFKIYYSRKSEGYTIRYLEWGSGNLLGYGKINASGRFETRDETKFKVGSVHPYFAVDSFTLKGIDYYFYATDEKPQHQELTIEDGAQNNDLVFYYRPKEVSIYYYAICLTPGAMDQEFGHVSRNMEHVTSSNTEGSTAMPASGFCFVGWYTSYDCTTQVSTDSHLKPDRPNEDVSYYALFEPITTDLTIKKDVSDAEESDNFLFRIQGQGKHAYIDLMVSITGDASVVINNLPIGEYRITELTDWSWEYGDKPTWTFVVNGTQKQSSGNIDSADYAENAQIKINEDGGAITFTNTFTDSDWLENETSKDNIFEGVATP